MPALSKECFEQKHLEPLLCQVYPNHLLLQGLVYQPYVLYRQESRLLDGLYLVLLDQLPIYFLKQLKIRPLSSY